MIAINSQTWKDIYFKKLEINQVILSLDSSKTCQESDLPMKIIKVLNKCLAVSNFPC